MRVSLRSLRSLCHRLKTRRLQLKKSMEGSCRRNHHSSQRTMSVLILIRQIGRLESKVFQSQKDHFKPFGQNCSPHNSKHDIESLLVLHRMVKMQGVLHLRKLVVMNKKLLLMVSCCEDHS